MRCSYCHGPEPTHPCQGCRTVLHTDCWAISIACPTFGCAEEWDPPLEPLASAPDPASLRAHKWWTPGLTVFAIALLVMITGTLDPPGPYGYPQCFSAFLPSPVPIPTVAADGDDLQPWNVDDVPAPCSDDPYAPYGPGWEDAPAVQTFADWTVIENLGVLERGDARRRGSRA